MWRRCFGGKKMIGAYAERGAYICNGFGMTETGPTAFYMDEQSVEEKIGPWEKFNP